MALDLLAVGVPIGRASQASSHEAPRLGIRLGASVHLLDLVDYLIWAEALSLRSRADLDDRARERTVENAEALLVELLEIGLLIEWNPTLPEGEEVLREHRVSAKGLGVGNVSEDPTRFCIASDSWSPRAELDAVMYAIWSASPCLSIYTACERLAQAAGMQISEVTDHVLTHLPTLVKGRLLYLDQVED